jgi:hypothetical protein
MDAIAINTLAANVVAALTPYLAKAGEQLARQVEEAAWEKLKTIYAAVKNRLTGDVYAEQTLDRLEQEPQSPSRQAALAGILEEKLKDDPAFNTTLQMLLAEAKAAGAGSISQTVNVSGQARTGDINLFGKGEGNIDLSKKR